MRARYPTQPRPTANAGRTRWCKWSTGSPGSPSPMNGELHVLGGEFPVAVGRHQAGSELEVDAQRIALGHALDVPAGAGSEPARTAGVLRNARKNGVFDVDLRSADHVARIEGGDVIACAELEGAVLRPCQDRQSQRTSGRHSGGAAGCGQKPSPGQIEGVRARLLVQFAAARYGPPRLIVPPERPRPEYA